ncbi:MAG: YveK family protein [Anaerolineae bacterium]
MGETTDNMGIGQYIAVFRRRFWLILLGVLLATGTAAGLDWRAKPIYEARAIVVVNQASRTVASDPEPPTAEELAKTYVELLKAPSVLDEVRTQHRLPIGISQLAKMVRVSLVRETPIIHVTVLSSDPALAAQVANAVPAVFDAQHVRHQMARLTASSQDLSRQMEMAQAELDGYQRSIVEAQTKPSPDAAEQARLQTKLAQARSTYDSLLAAYIDTRLAELRVTSILRIADPAQVPERPALPRTATDMVLGAMIGAIVSIGLAFTVDALDSPRRSLDEHRRAGKVPVAGVTRHTRESECGSGVETTAGDAARAARKRRQAVRSP